MEWNQKKFVLFHAMHEWSTKPVNRDKSLFFSIKNGVIYWVHLNMMVQDNYALWHNGSMLYYTINFNLCSYFWIWNTRLI